MPSTHRLNSGFLERACVQFSAPVSHVAPQEEFRHAAAFIAEHAREHPVEIATALTYRVVTSDAKEDRVGAWLLFDSAVRLAVSEQREAARREREERRKARDAADATDVADAAANEPGAPSPAVEDVASEAENATVPALAPAARRNVKFNALLDSLCGYLPKLIRYRWDETAVGDSLQLSYRAMRLTWTRAFHPTLVKEIRAACEAIRSPAEGPQQHECLVVSERLLDACWKLRREEPRPRCAVYVEKVYALSAEQARAIAADGGHRCPHIHPTVVRWLARLHGPNAVYCTRCDVWSHAESGCPAAPEHVNSVRLPSLTEARTVLERHVGQKTLESASPASHRVASMVLDECVSLLMDERSCEPLIAAFDALRRARMSSASRAALQVLASYRLRPTRVVPLVDGTRPANPIVGVDETHRFVQTPALAKALDYLATQKRRIRESQRLLAACRVLALEFAGAMDDKLRDSLRQCVVAREFVFTAVGLAPWDGRNAGPPRRKGPKSGDKDADESPKDAMPEGVSWRAARHLPEASALAAFREDISVLCRKCLGCLHDANSCPGVPTNPSGRDEPTSKAAEMREPWDFAVAARELKDAGVDFENREWTEHAARIAAVARDDHAVRGSLAAYVRMNRRFVAAALLALGDVPGRNRPYGEIPRCHFCDAFGHDRSTCVRAARDTLELIGFEPSVARLMPVIVRDDMAARQRGRPDRAVNDALLTLSKEEPRIARAVHDALEIVDRALRRVAARMPEGRYDSSLAPALVLLAPKQMEHVLRSLGLVSRHATIAAHVTFPGDEALMRAVTLAVDMNIHGLQTRLPNGVSLLESATKRLGANVTVTDLALQRTPLAADLMDPARQSSLQRDSQEALSVLADTITWIRQLADEFAKAARTFTPQAALDDALGRAEWSHLSQAQLRSTTNGAGSSATLAEKPAAYGGDAEAAHLQYGYLASTEQPSTSVPNAPVTAPNSIEAGTDDLQALEQAIKRNRTEAEEEPAVQHELPPAAPIDPTLVA